MMNRDRVIPGRKKHPILKTCMRGNLARWDRCSHGGQMQSICGLQLARHNGLWWAMCVLTGVVRVSMPRIEYSPPQRDGALLQPVKAS